MVKLNIIRVYETRVRGLSPCGRATYGDMVESGLWHLSRKQATRKGSWVQILLSPPFLESNAAALVRRPALKTGFREIGWGSTPLLSANKY